jgi:glycosyltransferase involved in cell wall biosynthesis
LSEEANPAAEVTADPGHRPRLLFVSERAPDRSGSGLEKRLYSFLRAYSTFCDIDLWYANAPDRLPDDAPESTRVLCRSAVSFMLGPTGESLPEFQKRLQTAASGADILHVTRTHWLIGNLSHPRIMWDIDEAPPQLNVRNGWRKSLNRLRPRFRRFVAKQDYAERVFVSSELERSILGRATVVIPNAVTVNRPSSALVASSAGPVVLFTGALGYYPNLHGIEVFIRHVWPRILTGCPNARLLVVGRLPGKPHLRDRVMQLADSRNVDFAFNVPELGPYYEKATVVVAPIWLGGGTRVKIIEAFAYGRPVVSTIKGCEGLDVVHGKQLLVAGSRKALARACLQVIGDMALGRTLSDKARAFYLKNHAQDVVTELVRKAVIRDGGA